MCKRHVGLAVLKVTIRKVPQLQTIILRVNSSEAFEDLLGAEERWPRFEIDTPSPQGRPPGSEWTRRSRPIHRWRPLPWPKLALTPWPQKSFEHQQKMQKDAKSIGELEEIEGPLIAEAF